MKTLSLLIGAAALALGAPATAQHAHHGHHMPAPAKKKPAAKKPAAKKPAAKKAAAKKKVPAKKKAVARKPAAKKAPAKKPAAKPSSRPAAPPLDPHAGHNMPPAPQGAPDPHAGHSLPPPPQGAPDPHAGHAMPAGDPHAGHSVGPAVDPPVAPPPAEAFSGPDNAADQFWDWGAMAQSRRGMRREHGGLPAYRLLVDRAEAQLQKGPNAYALDGEAWFGGDIDKLWIKAEADGEFGSRFEGAELQGLWSHAIDPWFDLQAGVRYDPRRGPDRAHLVAGVQGLAPYWIEVDAAAFLSDKGHLTARFEAEHDVRITQQLVLQPRAEADLALQNARSEAIGAGLSTLNLGARLRYQIRPEFAPYIGVQYERAFGRTRRYLREDGQDPGGFSLLTGVRFWL